MNDELKKRIDAINSGTVPEGYKKTKVGIVPAEWGEIKIGELCAISAGGDIEKEHCQVYKDEKYQFPVYANALTNKGLYGYSDVFKISGETVTVTGRGEIGCAIARSEKYYPIVRLLVLKPKKKTNIVFLENQINSSKICIESTGVPQLTAPQLSLLKIAIPPLPEQQKIAEILTTQDKLISLQERKIEQLKELKKAYLQKMFPQKGSQYPELRFKGFTDAWEQRKLNALSKRIIVGLATSVTPYYRESGVPILRNLNIKENHLDDSDVLYLDEKYADSQESKKIHTGDVLTVHTGYIGISCVVPEKYNNCLTFTTLITTTDESKLNGEYLSQYLNSEMGLSAVQTVTTQGGRQNLNTNDFVNVPIPYPSIEEQDKICRLLSHLDTLITLHQRKLEQEKQKKKALMQLLLTGKVRVKP